MKRKDLTGQRFGRWTVLGYSHALKRLAYWQVRCDCGTERAVAGKYLRRGRSRSCGCWNGELSAAAHTTHGLARRGAVSKGFTSWANMIARCTKEHHPAYPRYGGRGIQVCARWGQVENFIADMGEPPEGMSLDRIDNSGDYCPENCRWATWEEQNNNTRANRHIDAPSGERLTVAQAANRYGLEYPLLSQRLNAGWSNLDACLTRPSCPRLTDEATQLVTKSLGALSEIYVTDTADRFRLAQAAQHLEELADILAQCRRAS